MKRNILFIVMILGLTGLVMMQSCTKEGSGSYKEYSSFTTPIILAPANGDYLTVTGTTVELKWESASADGDAQVWDVYFGDSATPPLVKEGNTSQTYTVTVEKGVEYFWNVIGWDANGIPARSETWSFTVVDPASDMIVDMSWATDVAAEIGLDLTPEETVDMRLLIVNKSDGTVVAEEDGAGFETFADFNTLPDGEYLVSADIYATINAGDFNKPINIDITLAFNQPGVIDQTIDFPKVMTNANACDLYRTNLATVVKTGTSYTITESVSYVAPSVETWNGTDADYPSEVTTTESCAGKSMTGLGFGWMLEWWGEIIISGGTLTYETTATTITIPLQKYCKTTYNGAPQTEYYIQGTGTIDNSGAYPIYTIRYDFIQGGTSIAGVSMDYGWPTPYYEAVITTNPAGKKSLNLGRLPIPRPKR
jgi:hypothetical protein